MHELTIAQEVLRVVEDSIKPAGLEDVTCINLVIGALNGVQVDCLEFALEAITEGTPAKGLRLNIEHVEPLFRCRNCAEEFSSEGWFCSPCPKCGNFGHDLVKGDELSVASVDLA